MNPTPLLGIVRHKFFYSVYGKIELIATMTNNLPGSSGIYTLIITVPRPFTEEVGKLGRRTFAPGLYTYTGSALGKSVNLKARISRHLRSKKKTRWHIDYLLGSNDVAIKTVVYVETALQNECEVAQNIEQMTNIEMGIRGFGSSDCTRGCASHLHYFPIACFQEIVSRIIDIYKQVFRGALPPAPISYLMITDQDKPRWLYVDISR